MTVAIRFALASVASFAVFALVVTPPPIVAWSGGTLTLPSPVTTTRTLAGDCGCCACAGTIARTTAAASAAVPERQRRHAGGKGSVAARIDVAMNGLLRFCSIDATSANPREAIAGNRATRCCAGVRSTSSGDRVHKIGRGLGRALDHCRIAGRISSPSRPSRRRASAASPASPSAARRPWLRW